MGAHLLAWNPKKFNWVNLDTDSNKVESNGFYSGDWSCGSSKSIQKGDRLFLIRLGKEPKGICASGYATSSVHQRKHWSGEKGKKANYVSFKFNVLLNPEKEKILEIAVLKKGVLRKQNWSTRISGILINPTVTEKLEEIWLKFLFINKSAKVESQNELQKDHEVRVFYEGKYKLVSAKHYERSPFARSRCIEHYGIECSVCGFDFKKVYGDIGAGFIHVHHLKAIAKRKGRHAVSPIKDLRPICPNCHAMIHTKNIELSIDELKKKISKD